MMRVLTRLAIFALFSLCAAHLVACEESDVGIICQQRTSVDGEAGSFLITQQLECRDKLCVSNQDLTVPLSRCTKLCDGDGDCPGEGPNCEEGFVCRTGSTTNVLGLACCKLCLCKDDLSAIQRERDEIGERCETLTIEPDCPNI